MTEMACENGSSQKLSRLISTSLCLNRSGSYATELARNQTLIIEHMTNNTRVIQEQFEGGSTAEGTDTPESDVDRMIVDPDVVVEMSEENKEDLKKTENVLLLDTRMCTPGYARLQLLQLADTKKQFYGSNGVDIQEILEETIEGVFLSSSKFADLTVSILHKHDCPEYFKTCYRHGPSATIECGFPYSTEADNVFALVCKEWPAEAKEWIIRRRIHNWPYQSLIKKISNKKCYVVPIGNPESEYYALEWRISYLLGERELVWSFNDTQLHCYMILKQLLRFYFDKLAPDQLSSYHMKTIVFWLSEEKGLSMWFHENLLVCILACLHRLHDCIKQRQLPPYFNSHANLFGHKFQNDQQKKLILEKIQEVRTNITTSVLRCLPPKWKPPPIPSLETGMFAKLGYEFEVLENSLSTARKAYKILNAMDLYRSMFHILTVASKQEDFISIALQRIALEMNPPEGTWPLFLEKTKLFLDWRFAMAYFKEITVHENEQFQTCIQTLSNPTEYMIGIVSRASQMDEMSGKLYLATIYQLLRDYSMSTLIVNTLLHRRKNLKYYGKCSTYDGIQLTEDGLSKQVKSQDAEERTHNTFDVVFSYKDIHCVPYPFQFECAVAKLGTGTTIIMHPCIYANFLLCYGQYASKNFSSFKKNLKFLQMSVDKSKGGEKRHHALNILAYCYYLDRNLLKAFEYFKESLQETELSQVPNAAAFHIAIILLQKQKELEISH